MPAAKIKHTHKYKRVRFKSGNVVLFCVLPDCSNKINPALALGKRSICWRCGEEFILNEYSLRLAKPHCEDCHKPKKNVDVFPTIEETTDALDKLIHNPYITDEAKASLSLADRLTQTIEAAKTAKVEEEEL